MMSILIMLPIEYITIELRVSDVMVKNPVKIEVLTPINDVAKMMRDKKISSVILVKNDRPIGIITERDLVWRVLAAGKNPGSLNAFDVCSKPVVAISEHTNVEDAIDLMRDKGIRRLVVVDERDKIIGILTTDDLGYNLRSMSEDLAMKYMTILKRPKNAG